MMYSMHYIMQVSDYSVVRQPSLGVKNESVQDVLYEGPQKEATNHSKYSCNWVKVGPRIDVEEEQIAEDDCRNEEDMEPLDM